MEANLRGIEEVRRQCEDSKEIVVSGDMREPMVEALLKDRIGQDNYDRLLASARADLPVAHLAVEPRLVATLLEIVCPGEGGPVLATPPPGRFACLVVSHDGATLFALADVETDSNVGYQDRRAWLWQHMDTVRQIRRACIQDDEKRDWVVVSGDLERDPLRRFVLQRSGDEAYRRMIDEHSGPGKLPSVQFSAEPILAAQLMDAVTPGTGQSMMEKAEPGRFWVLVLASIDPADHGATRFEVADD
jgi:hypothetical protein